MTQTTNPDDVLNKIYSILDRLTECAEMYNGLFPSIIEPESGKIPFNLPEAIPGQRYCDRSFPGSNLMHDHSVLGLMYDLSAATGEERFAKAADRYLQYWSLHCTNTPTGLFPWGEHAFWHLEEDRIGNGYNLERVHTMLTHDHLLQAPVWLWEKLWSFNSRAVERFCIGLDGHYLDVENPPAYNRHANLLFHNRKRNRSGCDFPRHSGFHILDWSFACTKIDSPMFRRFLKRSIDYWWDKKYDNNTLTLSTTTIPENLTHVVMTISLAASLYESGVLLKEIHPELAELMNERARVYCDAFLGVEF
ncbi:MAG: hypothetical protein JXR97_10785, partial [Planctomycetes bacterium]|nr:hypothetical protein [Planctomycetota bacterium]